MNNGKRNIYILENQGEITKEEANVAREKWSLQLAGMAIENSLNKSKTTLTEELIKQTKQDVINSIKNTLVNIRNANTNERNMLNNERERKLKKNVEKED